LTSLYICAECGLGYEDEPGRFNYPPGEHPHPVEECLGRLASMLVTATKEVTRLSVSLARVAEAAKKEAKEKL